MKPMEPRLHSLVHPSMGHDLDGNVGRLGFSMSNFSPAVVADEWRFGPELSDVMVPEPSTLVLCGLATTFLDAYARRR